jgi:MFS family permease
MGLDSRWLLVAAAVLVESVGGLGYIFSVYSDRLKVEFSLGQAETDLLGTLSNLASTFGLHIGLLQDSVGPTPVLAIGGVLGVGGWLPLHFALARTGGWRCPYWMLAMMSVFQGHQMLITDVAVVPAVARSFPRQRGLALGLVKR